MNDFWKKYKILDKEFGIYRFLFSAKGKMKCSYQNNLYTIGIVLEHNNFLFYYVSCLKIINYMFIF